MTTIVGKAETMEQALSDDEELPPDVEEIGYEEELGEAEITLPKGRTEVAEDSLNSYCAQFGQIPLLNPDEWQELGSQVEDSKHVACLEEEWVAKYGIRPAASDLLLALADRFFQAGLLFEALCQYLGLHSGTSMAEKALHPLLRHAIDGCIDQQVCSTIAQATGASQDETLQA